MLLRNELQTALQDLEVACLEVADGHDGAAGILTDDPLAPTLRALAQARRAAAARLAEAIRQLDDLPAEPDADLETVRDLAARVVAALSPDQHDALAAERAAAEGHLVTLAEVALGQEELTNATRRLVEEIRADAAGAEQRLADIRNRLQ
jgi:hypothetical protein